ncbi:MAG: DUF2071 domain-containing protein [Firmicutes bacterium]|nr:DUF2071 domain-containing protein [Bacillota bacterium]
MARAAGAPGWRPWLFTQEWADVLFAHWPVPAAPLAARLPRGLALDTYQGQAWLGVVALRIPSARLAGVLPLPGAGGFAQVNLRTYVTCGGRPGVWFFSLDAPSRLGVAAARLFFRLPYFHARVRAAREEGWLALRSRRADTRGFAAELAVRYRPAGPAAPARPGSLDEWLTERYSFYVADGRGRLLRGDLRHQPWLLQPAAAAFTANTLAAGLGLGLSGHPPLLHYAEGMPVWFGPLMPAGGGPEPGRGQSGGQRGKA